MRESGGCAIDRGMVASMRGELWLILAQLVFACSALALKKLTETLPSTFVAALIIAVGALLLAPFLLVHQKELLALTREQIILVVVASSLWVALGATLYVVGLSSTGVSRTAVVSLIYPLFVTVLGVLIFGEKISVRFLLATALFVAGYLVLTTDKA